MRKKSLVPSCISSETQLTSSFSTPCTDGKWRLWSIHDVLWLLLLLHHVVFLLQHGAPPTHTLLQGGSYLQGAVIQEHTTPVWAPWSITGPARSQALPWASLSTGHSSCQDPPSAWAFHELQLPSEHIHWLLHALQGGYLLHHEPLWAAGRQPASAKTICRGICSSTRGISLLSFMHSWFSHILIPLFLLLFHSIFLFLSNMLIFMWPQHQW